MCRPLSLRFSLSIDQLPCQDVKLTPVGAAGVETVAARAFVFCEDLYGISDTGESLAPCCVVGSAINVAFKQALTVLQGSA